LATTNFQQNQSEIPPKENNSVVVFHPPSVVVACWDSGLLAVLFGTLPTLTGNTCEEEEEEVG
jgi:hypothetical protein